MNCCALKHIKKSIMTAYDNNDILSCRCGIKVEHMLFAYDKNDEVINKIYFIFLIYKDKNKFNQYRPKSCATCYNNVISLLLIYV